MSRSSISSLLLMLVVWQLVLGSVPSGVNAAEVASPNVTAPTVRRPVAHTPIPRASTTAAIPSLGFVGALGPSIETVAISGTIAYIGEVSAFTTLDVSDPARPVFLARLQLPGQTKDIKVVGNLAYVADSTGGLQIVDVTDPVRPVRRGSLATMSATALQVVGNYVYLVDYNGGLKIIDVSRSDAPILVSTTATTGGSAIDVDVVDTYAYVAILGGLIIFDVRNPAHPVRRSTLRVDTGDSYGIKVVGNLAYIASGSSGLTIIDISDPDVPMLVSSLNVGAFVLDVDVQEHLVYLAGRDFGLRIVDATNPTAPVLRASLDLPGSAYAVHVVDTRVYVAGYDDGLHIVDATTPATPSVMGSYVPAGTIGRAWVEGNLAYLPTRKDLRIVDLTTPNRPLMIGSIRLPGGAGAVHVVDGLAYVGATNDKWLHIVDVSDPALPSLRSSLRLQQPTLSIRITQGMAYLAGENEMLQIVDVGDPDHPALRATATTRGSARDLFVVGNFLYVADEESGLSIFDITVPGAPVLRGHYNTPGSAHAVVVVDQLAYVADSARGLLIFDVTEPSHPTLISKLDTPGLAYGVTVMNNVALVADASSLQVIDVTNPASPVSRMSFPFIGGAEDVIVENDLVVVTGYRTGLHLMSPSSEFVPVTTMIPVDGGTATSEDGDVSATFGANALNSTSNVLYLGQLDSDTEVGSPSTFQSARHMALQATLTATNEPFTVLRRFKMEGRRQIGSSFSQTELPFRITLRYEDDELAERGLTESTLNVAAWNGTSRTLLLPCDDCSLDTVDNLVSIPTRNFSDFALVATASAPTIRMIDQTHGSVIGGTGVRITGTGFRPGAEVHFGGKAATSVVVVDEHTLTAQTPTHIVGAVDVRVTNDDGQVATLPSAYTYRNPSPTVTSLSPGTALAGSSSLSLIVNGSGFVRSSIVHWGGASRPTAYLGSTRLRVELTAADLSMVTTGTVSVVTPGPGGGTATRPLSVIVPPQNNLLTNPGFELDANGDNQADSWYGNAAITRTTTVRRNGSAALRIAASTNADYLTTQVVGGVRGGLPYTLSGAFNIPRTTDIFSMVLDVEWLSTQGAVLRRDVAGSYAAATAGWSISAQTFTAPSRSTQMRVRLLAHSLNTTIYVDDLAVQAADLVVNGSFELDANGDTAPDGWSSNPHIAQTATRTYSGGFAMRHSALDNSSYVINQTVPLVQGGTTYAFSAAVLVPPTTDTFSLKLELIWRDAATTVLSRSTLGSVTSATGDKWVPLSSNVVAPPQATQALLRMVVSSLNATIYVDDLHLRIANVVANGGFEADTNWDSKPDDWSVNTGTARIYGGASNPSFQLQLSPPTATTIRTIQDVWRLTGGTSYTLSARVSIPNGPNGIRFTVNILWRDGRKMVIKSNALGSLSAPTGWTTLQQTFVAPAGTTSAQIQLIANGAGSTTYVDDVVLR